MQSGLVGSAAQADQHSHSIAVHVAAAVHLTHMLGMTDRITQMPDAATIERLADKAIRQLPKMLREYLPDVVIRVEEFADSETCNRWG
jgi:hypothetical protein